MYLSKYNTLTNMTNLWQKTLNKNTTPTPTMIEIQSAMDGSWNGQECRKEDGWVKLEKCVVYVMCDWKSFFSNYGRTKCNRSFHFWDWHLICHENKNKNRHFYCPSAKFESQRAINLLQTDNAQTGNSTFVLKG